MIVIVFYVIDDTILFLFTNLMEKRSNSFNKKSIVGWQTEFSQVCKRSFHKDGHKIAVSKRKSIRGKEKKN